MAARLGDAGGNENPYPANAEMNVTPFVDVILVLLIIFMIAAPLSTVSVPVELPPATTRPEAASADPVFVSIEKSGNIYVMEEQIALADLPAKLLERTDGKTSERIFLRADQNLAYRVVMQIMNVMQDAGFLKVGLVAEEIEPAAP